MIGEIGCYCLQEWLKEPVRFWKNGMAVGAFRGNGSSWLYEHQAEQVTEPRQLDPDTLIFWVESNRRKSILELGKPELPNLRGKWPCMFKREYVVGGSGNPCFPNTSSANKERNTATHSQEFRIKGGFALQNLGTLHRGIAQCALSLFWNLLDSSLSLSFTDTDFSAQCE